MIHVFNGQQHFSGFILDMSKSIDILHYGERISVQGLLPMAVRSKECSQEHTIEMQFGSAIISSHAAFCGTERSAN